MIDHDRAVELGAISLDVELSPAEAAQLAGHLETCTSCQDSITAMRADATALAGLATLSVPDGLRERILAAAAPAEAGPALAATTLESAHLPRTVRLPTRFRQPAVLAAAAAVIVAIIGGTLAWNASLSDRGTAGIEPSRAPASARPGGSATPTGSPTIGPAPTVTAWHPVAELAAAKAVGGEVDVATSFRLASVDGTPAIDLARRISVRPEVQLAIAEEPDGAVRLTPTEPLTPGATYRFTLSGDAGQTLDTWAFQASQPLRVVGTVPADTEIDVPRDTGIEITFDQDGVVDAAAHVSISPTVKGRFETHDRTLVFIPDKLKAATVYTVTVTRGVTVGATGEALEADVRFRFETAGNGDPATPTTTFRFANDLFESATAERPTIALWSFVDDSDQEGRPATPRSVRMEVYRLPDRAAAIEAFQALRSLPLWSRWNSAERLPTKGLRRVAGLDARLESYEGTLWTALPEALAAGWYLIEVPSPTHAAQAILQVTDVSAYLVVSDTTTLVWANDLATGRALAGATVSAAGTDLGRTADDGTLLATTPASLSTVESCTTACEPVVIVQSGGRSAFLPATGPRDPGGKDFGGDGWYGYDAGHTRYWRIFDSDRTLYRRTDTVNVWGVLRDRDSGAVPEGVTVRLVTSGEDGRDRPAIVTRSVALRTTGAFTGSLALDDVPEGDYALELLVAGEVVAERGIRVDRILKPAYQLDVVTGRHVYIAGDRIRITARATFFDGTPVPGVDLQIGGSLDATSTTDGTGTAIVRHIAAVDNGDAGWGRPDYQAVFVNPARAEEGEISGASRQFVVFPSMWTIAADGVVRDGRVRVSGTINVVDVERLEREIVGGASVWDLDPRGAAVAGTTVTARFVEIIRTRRQTGTEYDFVEKRVVPVYGYDHEEREAGSVRLTTDSAGRFSGSIAAPSIDHDYQVFLTSDDPDGHVAQAIVGAGAVQAFLEEETRYGPQLELTSRGTGDERFAIGDDVDLTMRPDAAGANSDRHLFYLAQRGLREVTVRASSRFKFPFPTWAAPNLEIGAVRFTGDRYLVAGGYTAAFRQTDRAITVDLATDAERYAPGGQVTLDVTTRDAAGKPVAATVIVRVVDEKLFAIDGAVEADPLGQLYAFVSRGIRATYASHRSPVGREEGGDTTGGGGRDAFADAVLFKAVETGADGRAAVTFRLSDDLTAWRISAAAVDAALGAGEGTLLIPVGLPFFVEVASAPEYLVADRPTILLRGYGSALEAGDGVAFDVESESLGLRLTGLDATAFEAVGVPLPALSPGTHSVTVTARTGSGASVRTDRITRTFEVVTSRLTHTRTTYEEVAGATGVGIGSGSSGDGLTEIVVTDAGSGQYLPLLLDLASVTSMRLERTLAADLAATLLTERFGAEAPPTVPFVGTRYQTEDGGLAVVPHASSDLEVTVLAALVAPDRFDHAALESYFRSVLADATETRERRNLALAGLAGISAGVLSEVRDALADPELTVRERLMLGLGAAALGDAASARSVAGDLVATSTETYGATSRLRSGADAGDVTAGTALLAMLLAATGDPLAAGFWAYVEANPSTDATASLHGIGIVRAALDWQAPVDVRFVSIVAGARTTITLRPGETFRLRLTPTQAATFAIEPVDGRLGLTTIWRDAVGADAFDDDPDLTIERTVTPSGAIDSADLVIVDLVVDIGASAPAGCHLVTDLVPSGLTPVGVLDGWMDPETGERPVDVTYPLEQVGQRVVFCAERPLHDSTVHLRYVARVVTPGSYAWEPAVVESRTGPDRAALTARSTIVID